MGEIESNDRDRKFAYIRDVIFVVVAVLSIIAFFRTCKYDGDLRRTNYELNSIGNRPLLKLAGPPDISRIEIDTLVVKFEDHPGKHSGSEDDPHKVGVRFSLDIESTVRITNTSQESIGKILVLLTGDYIPNVKSLLMGEEQPFEVRSSLHKWPELQNSDVLPGDTIEVSASTRIEHLAGRQYRMHFVILYENEMGHLFHTHGLVPFEFRPMLLSRTREMKVAEVEKALYAIVSDMITNNTFMQSLDPIASFDRYTETESAKVRENLQEMISHDSLE